MCPEMKNYIRTIIFLTSLTSFHIHGQGTSIFYTTKQVKCKATISQFNRDTIFVITPDSCTHPIFDTIFNGVYILKKIPSNITIAILSFKNKKLDGQQTEFYESGQIRELGLKIKNRRHGKWTGYYSTGEVSYVSYYKYGKEKSERYFEKNGKGISELEYYKYRTDLELNK